MSDSVDRKTERTVQQGHIAALREETYALRSVLDGLHIGVVVSNHHGRIVLFNASASRMLDIGSDGTLDLAGWFLPDMVTPFPSDRLPFARALLGEQVGDTEIYIRNAAFPEGACVLASGGPWTGGDGAFRGVIVVYRDITAHRAADRIVERLSNAVEQTADCVMITDRDGLIEYVNPAFERTTGYAMADLAGGTPRILKSGRHEQALYEKMWTQLLAGTPYRATFFNRRKSGDYYYFDQTITPMTGAGGLITHFVSVSKDVTEKRRQEAIEIELRLAARVQQRLYPRPGIDLPGVDIAGIAHPSTQMCGDYFDYFMRPDGTLAIVVGDATGHGIGPALLMAETRASLRTCLALNLDPAQSLHRVNAMLTEDLAPERFMTMILATLDPRTGIVTYVNHGHPTGYVLDRAGEIRGQLDSMAIPLGISAGLAPVPARQVRMMPGDLLLLMTDGIPECEAPTGHYFGVDRILALVRRRRAASALDILRTLHDDALAFLAGEPQRDDLTAVICKLDPPA